MDSSSLLVSSSPIQLFSRLNYCLFLLLLLLPLSFSFALFAIDHNVASRTTSTIALFRKTTSKSTARENNNIRAMTAKQSQPHYDPIDTEEREAITTESLEDQQLQLPVWDPVAQIYVGGIVPQQQCIHEMIRANNGKLRIFGYGSLCWNPGKAASSALAHESVISMLGKAVGYRRAWAQKSTDHRGLPEFPGIVCTLLTDEEFHRFRQPCIPCHHKKQNNNDYSNAGSLSPSLTEGLIYEVPPELVDECLQELDFREKGGYARDIINVVIDKTDEEVQALLYRGTPDNPAFWPRALKDLPFAAATIALATGPSGENHVYLNQLDRFLEESSSPGTLEQFDDTFLLANMTNKLRKNNNLHFLVGCGSNQYNQLLLHSDTSAADSDSEDVYEMKEIVLCAEKTAEPDLVANIYAGGGHCAFLTQAGGLFLCGWNGNGQLGSSGIDKQTTSPLPVIKKLVDIRVEKAALGFTHTLIIERDTGRLFAFGDNTRGQVDGTTSKCECVSTPTTPKFLENEYITDVSAGLFHSAVITSKGEVITFGCGRFGQSLSNLSSENVWSGRWKPSDGSQLIKVSCGRRHTTVLDSEGRIWTFGENKHGQLGRDTSGVLDPNPGLVEISGGESMCMDVCSGWSHVVVLAKDLNGLSTKVYGWGRNDRGQLGNGFTNNIPRALELFESYKGITMISCGSESTVFVDESSNIYSCGWNEHGNLAHGCTEDSFEPKKTIGARIATTPGYPKGRTRLAVAAGGAHLLAMNLVSPKPMPAEF